jgi:hypothetical protein
MLCGVLPVSVPTFSSFCLYRRLLFILMRVVCKHTYIIFILIGNRRRDTRRYFDGGKFNLEILMDLQDLCLPECENVIFVMPSGGTHIIVLI